MHSPVRRHVYDTHHDLLAEELHAIEDPDSTATEIGVLQLQPEVTILSEAQVRTTAGP